MDAEPLTRAERENFLAAWVELDEEEADCLIHRYEATVRDLEARLDVAVKALEIIRDRGPRTRSSGHLLDADYAAGALAAIRADEKDREVSDA